MISDGQISARRRLFLVCCLGNVAATLLLWTLYLLTIRPYVLAIEPQWLSRVLAETVRFVAFVVPTVVAIWGNPYDSFRAYGVIFGRAAAGIRWGLGVGGILVVLNALAAYLSGRSWAACQAHLLSALPVAFGTGVLFEELTYRGYLFRNLCSEVSPSVGYVGSAAVFVSIHVPGWLLAQHLSAADIAQRSASIFALALVLAFVLRRSGSIYAPLLVHAANNFMSVVCWK
jgi:membrane protease YdiL (CAAX protease family)